MTFVASLGGGGVERKKKSLCWTRRASGEVGSWVNMAGDEDGGWAELATCPHGVQGNNVVLA